MKVLWILPKWPLPEIDGATKAHMALLDNWPTEIALDLVVFSEKPKNKFEQSELQKRINFNQLLVLPYSNTPTFVRVLAGIFKNTLPATAKRFVNNKAKRLWNNWSSLQSWDVVVFDGLHPAALYFKKTKTTWSFPKAKKICLRAHNVESELWEQAQKKALFFLKWVYKKEKERMNHFENAFLSCCDLVVPVSKKDAEKIQTLHPQIAISPQYIGLDWTKIPKPINSSCIELLFVGRLDWYPNAEGLKWFLDTIWPEVLKKRKSSIKLHVVASVVNNNWLKRLNNTPNLIFHGKVNKLSPYYQSCALSIIPILTGSGTRVKAIESAQFGRSFIATSKGIEGLELSSGIDFIEANTNDEWINALCDISLESCIRLGNHVYEIMKNSYDRLRIQKNFIKLLEKISDKT